MCFTTFTYSIWIDYLENNTKEQVKGEEQCHSRGLKATIDYAITQLDITQHVISSCCGNRLQQLDITCAKCASVYTLPAIAAICKLNFFSVKVLIDRRYFSDQTSRRLLSYSLNSGENIQRTEYLI